MGRSFVTKLSLSIPVLRRSDIVPLASGFFSQDMGHLAKIGQRAGAEMLSPTSQIGQELRTCN
jgi:hypothetical protein